MARDSAGAAAGAFLAAFVAVAREKAERTAEDELALARAAGISGDVDGTLAHDAIAAASYAPLGDSWTLGYAALRAAGTEAEAKKDGIAAARAYEAMREAAVASDAVGHDTGRWRREAEEGRLRSEALLESHAPYANADAANAALRRGWADHPAVSPPAYAGVAAMGLLIAGAVAAVLRIARRPRQTDPG